MIWRVRRPSTGHGQTSLGLLRHEAPTFVECKQSPAWPGRSGSSNARSAATFPPKPAMSGGKPRSRTGCRLCSSDPGRPHHLVLELVVVARPLERKRKRALALPAERPLRAAPRGCVLSVSVHCRRIGTRAPPSFSPPRPRGPSPYYLSAWVLNPFEKGCKSVIP